jgi:cob(I)alamin adenosyltransferase
MQQGSAQQGLLLVFTGSGKGKTTAALGLAMRAMGHGRRVAMIQFIKSMTDTGEARAAQRFHDLMDWHVMGKGFTWNAQDPEIHRQAARSAWEMTCQLIGAAAHDLIILDEFTYVVNQQMLPMTEVINVLSARPPEMDLVITGRDAPAPLLEIADLITEMQAVRHPFQRGIRARAGMEF